MRTAGCCVGYHGNEANFLLVLGDVLNSLKKLLTGNIRTM